MFFKFHDKKYETYNTTCVKKYNNNLLTGKSERQVNPITTGGCQVRSVTHPSPRDTAPHTQIAKRSCLPSPAARGILP